MRFPREAIASEMLMGLARNLTADIADEEMIKSHGPGQHSATWILGHLARVNDKQLVRLGQQPVCPESWAAFDPGSPPDAAPSSPPAKAELLEKLDTSRKRLLHAMEAAPADLLSQPHGIERIKDAPVKTVGELLSFLATAHFAMHLGQLSTFRRQLGRPALF